jgi:hypothetical protein
MESAWKEMVLRFSRVKFLHIAKRTKKSHLEFPAE